MANAGLEGFAKALALELPEGQRIMVIYPPLVKETAKVMGMDESQSPSAIEVAHTYLKGLKGNKNGDILFV